MSRYSRISWTSSDYDSIRADALALIATTFPDFTRTNPADPAMAAFELVCYVGDLIRYYQDRQANEAFLITATERQSVIRHLAGLGYRLATAAPAGASLLFTLAQPYGSPVTFQQGSRIETDDGLVGGELVDNLELAPGVTSGTIDWLEGRTVAEDVSEGSGLGGQAYQLGQTPFLWDSETITVDGIAWARVDDFLSSGASDQTYVVEVDAFDQATVRFGDGANGAIPASLASIAANYRVGGGAAGNVEAGTLRSFVGTVTAADGTTVSFTVTNPIKASGGTPRETSAHGKLYGPKALATNGRAVTNADYQTIAERVAGVARALAQTSNEDPVIAENTVHLQIIPEGSGTPTQALLDLVESTVTPVKGNTTRLRVLPGAYLTTVVAGTVYLRRLRSGLPISASAIEREADAILRTSATAAAAGGYPGALDAYFDALNVDVEVGDFTVGFGALLPVTDITGAICGAGTLRKFVDLVTPGTDIVLTARLFPRLGPYTKAVYADRVEFSWTGTVGSVLVVREEP